MITNHHDRPIKTPGLSLVRWINKRRAAAAAERERERLNKFTFLFTPYICSSYEKCCHRMSISLKSQLLIPPRLQLQQAISNHSKTCPEGTGEENESSKYSRWPLQTPSMINVKGFLFLICQTFQRSLTYAYFQPQRSHHSSRWSGTSKPITARPCWGWRCQSCKLAHLQPFIMHCSKEQLVFLREGWRRTM